ncbi:hypothetical protein ABIB25_005029 [Nakamurella sp. UYEF19]|uniref:hypothetical protein n=1 Tax=Nakamurella sp. UYEF19 TaxID=1756392 RepID=UPI00339394A2
MARHRGTPRNRWSRKVVAVLAALLMTVGGVSASASTSGVTAVRAAAQSPIVLFAGQKVDPGGRLTSPNRFVSLRMQLDGNLVLVAGGHVMWYSKTAGRGNYLQMDANGNVGVFSPARRQLWSTRTSGRSNMLLVGNDGNLTVRVPGGRVLWNLNTKAAELDAGNAMYGRQFLTGRGGEALTMQSDGNLVLRRGGAAIWNSRTYGHPGGFVQVQGDGNLVVYGADRRPLWHTGGAGAGARLAVQSTGNLELRTAKGALVWQTNTPKVQTAAQLAAQLIGMWGGKVTGLPGAYSDLLATSRNQTITNGDSCGRTVRVDIRLVRFLVQLTANYKIKINNIITGHGCDGAQHPKGRATDLATATSLTTGASTSFGGISGPNNLEMDRLFVNYISTILPTGSGIGQRNCAGQSSARPRPGIQFFADACNHQHVQFSA